MPDSQYWREMDKATHYPPAQKKAAEAKALAALKKRERTTGKVKAKTKPPAKKKKVPKKNGAKKIRKARKVTKSVLTIFR